MATLARGEEAVVLASEPPFRLGTLAIAPALRQVRGGGESRTLEPRVMQVLVALARAQGEIVGRDDLIARCWDGRIVGENAINRVISLLRHLAAETQAFEIETVTKVGYRLKPCGEAAAPQDVSDEPAPAWSLTRRAVIAGAGVAAVGGIALLSSTLLSRPNRKAREFYDAGLRVREASPDNARQAVAYFQRAADADPEFADAWGELAYSRVHLFQSTHEEAQAPVAARIVAEATRALRLDPKNRKAILAKVLLRPYFRNWLEIEREIKAALAHMPDEILLHRILGRGLTETGRWREATREFALVAAREPLVPVHQLDYASALWHAGDIRAAGKRFADALQNWPTHEWLWMNCFLFLSFTGQVDAATAMADRPVGFGGTTPLPAKVGIDGLTALKSGNRRDMDRAIKTVVAARRGGDVASFIAIRYLAALGAVDASYAQAFDYYLGRRDPVTGERKPLAATATRHTDFLFMAATAPMRADPRFSRLTAQIGLDAYWAGTRTRPDYRAG